MIPRLHPGLVAAGVTLALLGGSAHAETLGYRSANTVGLEIGLPLVAGLEFTHRTDRNLRLGLGLGRMGGLTAIRAEATWLMRPEYPGKFVPLVVAGADQFLLKSGDSEASPAGLHGALGMEYHFESGFSMAARMGVLTTFGSSGSEEIKVFAVRNGFTTGFLNVGVRYHL